MRRSTVLWIATLGLAIGYLASAVALGSAPDATDDGAAVAAWFRTNGSHVRWWLWLGTLSLVFFGVFAAFVRARLPEVYKDVFFVGAVILVAESAVSGWIWAGMAWHAGVLEPATARTLLDVASFWGPVLTCATVLMFAPITIVASQGDAGLPRWLAVVTGIAVVEQLTETVTIFGDRGFTAPGGPMNLLLGAGLTLIAFVTTGIVVARTTPD